MGYLMRGLNFVQYFLKTSVGMEFFYLFLDSSKVENGPLLQSGLANDHFILHFIYFSDVYLA